MPSLITTVQCGDEMMRDDEPIDYPSEAEALKTAGNAAAQILADELLKRESPVALKVSVERIDGSTVAAITVSVTVEYDLHSIH